MMKMSFEFYGDDIRNGKAQDVPDLTQNKDHPQAEYLKYKNWYLEYPVQDNELSDGDRFLSKAADVFRRMKPFNDYLNKALTGFKMPVR